MQLIEILYDVLLDNIHRNCLQKFNLLAELVFCDFYVLCLYWQHWLNACTFYALFLIAVIKNVINYFSCSNGNK